MTVCTMTAMDEVHTAHIRVFSRFALLDCTGLSASVRTKRMINNDRYVYVILSVINTLYYLLLIHTLFLMVRYIRDTIHLTLDHHPINITYLTTMITIIQ